MYRKVPGLAHMHSDKWCNLSRGPKNSALSILLVLGNIYISHQHENYGTITIYEAPTRQGCHIHVRHAKHPDTPGTCRNTYGNCFYCHIHVRHAKNPDTPGTCRNTQNTYGNCFYYLHKQETVYVWKTPGTRMSKKQRSLYNRTNLFRGLNYNNLVTYAFISQWCRITVSFHFLAKQRLVPSVWVVWVCTSQNW